MLEDIEIVYLVFLAIAVLTVICALCCGGPEEPTDQPPESLEQRATRALALHEKLAARAAAVLAEQAAVARPVLLPYFPYAGRGGRTPETPEWAICLEPLRQGQLCSEVPACRHVFHRECLGVWARSNGSCPMCRAKIVPGSHGAAVAEEMV